MTTDLAPLRLDTPLDDYLLDYGLLVKREDLSCPFPGPPFSKTRGVLAHMTKRKAEGMGLFGALDTYHSQAGHAVAWAARQLGAECVNYFPVYKADLAAADSESADLIPVQNGCWMTPRPPQVASRKLGASLVGLPAGRSAVLYHSAKRDCLARGGYMMPNALKLPETLEETAAEVKRTWHGATEDTRTVLRYSPWLISCSSATIASGVLAGLFDLGLLPDQQVILHMGYTRSLPAVADYIDQRFVESGRPAWRSVLPRLTTTWVSEGYAYKDQAKPGPTPPWPCNHHYDLKAFRWWMREGRERFGTAVLWNIG